MRTVFVSGNFNVLHPGHLRLLRFAKELGDRLIVAIASDALAGSAVMVPESLRLEGLQSNLWVDDAFIYNEDISDVLLRIRPDIVVKGQEFEGKHNREKFALDSYGGKLIFSSGDSFFSSQYLIDKELNIANKSIRELGEFSQRHRITTKNLKNIIKNFKSKKVLVVGDLIVDEYISCEALGMSQEDPTLVVKPIEAIKFLGGSGIVAAHARGLGADVMYISIAGDDQAGAYASKKLEDFGVSSQIIIDETRPTTLKQRYRASNKTLLRVSSLQQNPVSLTIQETLFNAISKSLDEVNLVVFSDFNYGCLPQSLVERVIKACSAKGIPMIADSQASSQMGDIGRFKEMMLITPTEREARLSARNDVDGLVVLAQKLLDSSGAQHIFVKLNQEGVLLCTRTSLEVESWHTDKIEALNLFPKDTAGAGDSMLISAGLALISGATIWEAGAIGSVAAAIQVGRIGNLPLSYSELEKQL
jgi:rfaE bifunctional protein kinase chain/domain